MYATHWSKTKGKSYLLGWEVEGGQDEKFYLSPLLPKSFNLPEELKYMKKNFYFPLIAQALKIGWPFRIQLFMSNKVE